MTENKTKVRRFEQLIGASRAMCELFDILERIVENPVASTILITGESGTGKQLVAKALHTASPRASKSFMEFNCAAIPESLLESELFGHEAGAFTDAREGRTGLFQLADGGTIFLDEIGEMPLATQAKLLKVIEDKKFRPVGGSRDVSVDVRVVAATNKELARETSAGRFREDLYWRLNVVPIYVSPLRKRREDIEPLALQFMSVLNRKMKREFKGFSEAALQDLKAYSWPGNVRELRNVVERGMLLETDITISHRFLNLGTQPGLSIESSGAEVNLDDPDFSLDDYLSSIEKNIISDALDKADGNQSEAARILKLSREILRYRIKKYGLKIGRE